MSKQTNVSEGRVKVSIGEKGYASHITVNGQDLAADEPASVGGGGTGPTPYDLLLAALGSCKTMTMRMYAERKGWLLESATVSLHHRRIHAADCATCDTQQGRIDHIDVQVQLHGSLTDEQQQRLLEIADRCPVHRTLTTETVIESSLIEQAD